VRGLLSSPRRRRRAIWLGSLLLIVAGAVALGILYPNTAGQPDDVAVNDPRPGQVYREPKTVRLPKADRDRALRNALQFVNTAVARRRVESSYDLVSPELRQGMSRSEWGQGEIPVVPFPAAEVRVRIDYSYRDELGLTMLLIPPAASNASPTTFNMDMRAAGAATGRRWLVSSWMPTASTTPSLAAEEARSGPATAGFPNLGQASESEEGLDAPLSAAWIVVPLSIFGLMLLLPIGLGIRSWLQNRRALREYEATRTL
jgi:hypothetical protein